MHMQTFKKTIYSWQVPCLATAVSAVNNKFGIVVMFSLADAEFSKDPALNEAETTGVVIHYKDENALWELANQYGKHCTLHAITGKTDIGFIR